MFYGLFFILEMKSSKKNILGKFGHKLYEVGGISIKFSNVSFSAITRNTLKQEGEDNNGKIVSENLKIEFYINKLSMIML